MKMLHNQIAGGCWGCCCSRDERKGLKSYRDACRRAQRSREKQAWRRDARKMFSE